MSVKQISIFLEHKPGSLYDLTMTLAENDINIRALTVAETGEMALIRLIVDNFLWTAALLKNSGYHATFNDVIVARISNVPGGLNHILEVLYDANVNIEHTYSIMASKNVLTYDNVGLLPAYMVFEVDDFAKASDVLKKAGIQIIKQGELSGL